MVLLNNMAIVHGTFLCVVLLGGSTSKPEDTTKIGAYRILSADGRAQLPFEFVRGDIVLKAEVNNKELRLALDNGVLWDELLLYGGPKIDALGLKYDGNARLGTDGDVTATEAHTASGIIVRFPGVELKNESAVVTPADSRISKMFLGENGVISGSLFKRFVVRLDFEKKIITLIDPGKFERTGERQTLPLTPFGPASFTIPCMVQMPDGGSVAVNPVVDLGGVQPLLLYLGGRDDLSVPEGAKPASLGIGVNGHIDRVLKLKLGKYTLENVTTGFTDTPGILGEKCEGLLGPLVFARFTTTFDYRDKVIILEPNSLFGDKFALP